MSSKTSLATLRTQFEPPFTIDRAVVGAFGRFAKASTWLLLLGVGYALAARLSQQDLFLRSRIGLFWVPNALVLSALLLTPRRWWLAVAAVSAIAHILAMSAANPAWRMVWQLAANGVYVYLTAELLRRSIGLPMQFATPREALRYTGVAFVMPLLLAYTAPAFVLSFIGVEALFSPPIAFLRLVLANLSPLLLVTPAIVLCSRLDAEWRKTLTKQRMTEGACIFGSLIIIGVVAFDADQQLARFPWLLVLTFPPLLWAAVRLGPTGASVSLLCIGALSLLGATRQHGPFVVAPNGDAVFALEIYWILISPPVLLLAAAVSKRARTEAAFQEQGDLLAREKRAAVIDEVSGVLAHELRQPLAAILANAQAVELMLSRQPADLAAVREILHDIQEQNGEAASIISRVQLTLKNEERPGAQAMEKAAPGSLPLGASTMERTSAVEHTEHGNLQLVVRGNARPLIAILDDQPSVRVALVRLCRAYGLDAREFATGPELFASLKHVRPDCLILDAQMPTLGGLQVHRWLRDHNIDIPAILITGRHDDLTYAQAVAHGASAFLSKPVDGDTLIRTIERVLRITGGP